MIRDLLPPTARKVIYTVLGVLVAVNGVLDLVDGDVMTKVIEVAAVLGFTLAAGNTPAREG